MPRMSRRCSTYWSPPQSSADDPDRTVVVVVLGESERVCHPFAASTESASKPPSNTKITSCISAIVWVRSPTRRFLRYPLFRPGSMSSRSAWNSERLLEKSRVGRRCLRLVPDADCPPAGWYRRARPAGSFYVGGGFARSP